MKRERLIRRYEHNHFRGWVVATKRRGKRFVRYFSDRTDGISKLPWPTKTKRTNVRNKTGVIGVARVKERTRSGKIMRRYVASWSRRDGTRGKATFSIGLYGEEEAFKLAVRAMGSPPKT